MVNPSAVCVRCSSHASMCMMCTEVMAQEALNFYRKTRARGAASLFANAITQTGITKVIKFAVFKQWVNGMRLRQHRAKKQEFSAARAFQAALVKKPFRAWVKFTKDSVLERNHKTIEELLARMGILEAQVGKAVAERSAFEQQAKWVDKILKERDALIERQQVQIEEQTSALHEAQRRIVGLSSTLAGPLLAYGQLVKTTATSLSGEFRRRFLRAARSTTPAHDYATCFDDADEVRRSLKKEAERRSEKRAVKLDDTAPMVEILLGWANTKAKMASVVAVDLAGTSLQDFLPKFRVADSVEDLSSGSTILRLVVTLMFERASPHGTTLRLPSSHAETETVGADAPALLVLTESIVQDIKAAATSQKEVVDKALSLAHKHLRVPLFKVADVVGGEVPATLALLSHLMLASSTSAVPPQSLQHIAGLIRMFDVQEAAVGKAQAAVTCDSICSLRDRLLEYKGLKEVDVPDTLAESTPVDVEQPGDVSSTTEGQIDANIDAETDANARVGSKPKPPHQPPLDDPAIKYSRLLSATDACLLDGSLLEQQVGGVREAVGELLLLGASLEEIEVGRDSGMRLATDVKLAVSAFQFEVILKELKWAT